MYRVIMVENRQVSSMNPQPAEVLRTVELKVLFEFVTGLVTGQLADGIRLVSETNLTVVIGEPSVVEQ